MHNSSHLVCSMDMNDARNSVAYLVYSLAIQAVLRLLVDIETCSWHQAFFFTHWMMIVIRCLLSVRVLSAHAFLPYTKGRQPHTLLSASHFLIGWFFIQLYELPVSSPCSFWLFSAVLCVSDLSPFSGMYRLSVCLLFPQKFNILKLVTIYIYIFIIMLIMLCIQYL